MRRLKPFSGMIIQEDVEFEAGIYDFPAGEGIQIAASGIRVSGHNTVLLGPGQAGDMDSFLGVGITAHGQDHVILEGLTVRGFQLGLEVTDGDHWDIINNDFSYNYTDEEYGWGEGSPFGAVLLRSVEHSRIVGNTAIGNWNGLNLNECDNNEVRDNRFSHCTNVCLKLWNSSHNRIEGNNFSYGLRIRPGEVHARDSTCVLLESGSNDNQFIRNDCTHGGDGVFIRPLNGWHSQRNYFEGNDASFAHNNAWECWSPNNTFVRNKGNYSSYGFWLGGSDGTVMIGNEAAYNGTIHKNAPEKDFGHSGIAVVHGSSSHFRLIGNMVHHNRGPGVALGFKPNYRAMHWLMMGNFIRFNLHGLYIRDADDLVVVANDISDNLEHAIVEGSSVSNVRVVPVGDTTMADIDCPDVTLHVGGNVRRIGRRSYALAVEQVLTAEFDPMNQWNALKTEVDWVEDGVRRSSGWKYATTFHEPGYHRVCLHVSDDDSVNLEWLNLYVVDTAPEIGTEDPSEPWQVLPYGGGNSPLQAWAMECTLDSHHCIVGEHAVRLSIAAPSFRMRTTCNESWRESNVLQFWIRIRHHTVFGLKGAKHRVRIGHSQQDFVEYDRHGHLFEGLSYNEAWEDWNFVQIPYDGDHLWTRTTTGSGCAHGMTYIELLHEGTDEEPGTCEIWLDGLQVVNRVGI